MISTYLENAIRFERLAAEESDLASKTEFGKQAISYRKLAAERARKLTEVENSPQPGCPRERCQPRAG
jgi:hypothetical protein